ncbi:MAG: tRNA (adenine(22)-N(1))-methyltransferase TrmK [Desulfotalea sp.]
MKLSKRLKKIESMVAPDYTRIWDCCCDHGLLGSALLSRLAAPHIHFVDIVPELIGVLENKLERFYSNCTSSWSTHCHDVALLSIARYEGRNLVIIAGVGGDLMTQVVSAIHLSHPSTIIDFLLCPVYHQFTLRQQLIKLDFNLKDEVLIEENQRFYEILLVSSSTISNDKQVKISPVGELIWHANTAEQEEIALNYLKNTLNHFQRMKRGNNSDIQKVIDAYHAVKINCLTI